MNILLFLKNLQARGISKAYLNIAKGLKLYGHNPIIVIREDIQAFKSPILVKVISNNITKEIDTLIQTYKIDFILSNNVKFLEGLNNIDEDKIFYSVHMLWGERIFKQLRLKKWLELKKEYKDKNIIAISNAVKRDLLHKIKVKPKRIEVIPDIVDYEEIRKKSNAFVPKEQNYIINIAAFSKEKNHTLLLQTFAKLNKNLELLLLGKGALEDSIKKLAKKLGIEKRVHFLGFVENPYPYIKYAKLMLATSSNEGLHSSLIESLLLNTPVVSTNSKGVQDILKGELSHFIAHKNNLLEITNQALKAYPFIDIEKFKKKFSFENIKKYEKIFNEYQ